MTDQPPPATSLRRDVERRSAPVLLWLRARPRFLLPALVVVLLVGGLAAPPAYGVVMLGVLALLLVWLVYLSWPVLDGRARGVRLAVLALVAFAALRRVVE